MLAYKFNFTTNCSSQDCTAANYGGNILLAILRGLANGDSKEEILSMMEQISLEDAIVIMRESEVIEAANAKTPTQTIGFRNTPTGSERCAQVVTTSPMAQRDATQAEVLPKKVPSEQVEVEVRPADSINLGVHLARRGMAVQSINTSQHQQIDETAPEFYP